ncbi:uncharacterized protein LOC141916068 [Strix aluco]|uniref:uncharacterized protein LOC141916068 n=1 Tax=Strix aluco TaxID=111821 RepID=UPI003DA4883C
MDQSILQPRRVPSGAPGSSGEGRSPAWSVRAPARRLAVVPRLRRAPGAGSRVGTRRSPVPAPRATEEPPPQAHRAAPTPPGLCSAINTLPFSPSPFASLFFTPSSIFFFPLPPPTSPLPPALPPALSPPTPGAQLLRVTAASNQKGSKAAKSSPGPRARARRKRVMEGRQEATLGMRFLSRTNSSWRGKEIYSFLQINTPCCGSGRRKEGILLGAHSQAVSTRRAVVRQRWQLVSRFSSSSLPGRSRPPAGTGTVAPGAPPWPAAPPADPQPLGSATGPQSPGDWHHPVSKKMTINSVPTSPPFFFFFFFSTE